MKIKSEIIEEYLKILETEKRKKKSKKNVKMPYPSINPCDSISSSSPDFQEKLNGCLLFTSQTFSEDEIRSSSENVRLFLSELTFVAKGGNGYVFSSKTSTDKKIIIKFDDLPYQSQNYHESFVGLAGTNLLRKKIPNFAMILGKGECSFSPEELTKSDLQNIEWCLPSVDEKKKMFFYEYVPGDTLEMFLYKKVYFLSREEIMNIFLQIILSLIVAADEINFTHYDLNLRNIIIRELDEKVKITYSSKSFSSPITITTSLIPTFIDYSFSNIRYSSVNYGEEKNSYFITNDENIFADIFKVLSRSLEECYSSSVFSKGDSHFFAVLYLIRLIHLFLPIEDVLLSVDNDDFSLLKEFFFFSRKVSNLPKKFTEEVSRKKFVSLISKKFLPRDVGVETQEWSELVKRKNQEALPFPVKNLNTLVLLSPPIREYFSPEVDVDYLIEKTLIYLNILIGKIEEYQIYNQRNDENSNSFFVSENIHCIEETLDAILKAEKEISLLLAFTDFTNEILEGLVSRYNSALLFIERFRKILIKVISKRTAKKFSDFFDYKFKFY